MELVIDVIGYRAGEMAGDGKIAELVFSLGRWRAIVRERAEVPIEPGVGGGDEQHPGGEREDDRVLEGHRHLRPMGRSFGDGYSRCGRANQFDGLLRSQI